MAKRISQLKIQMYSQFFEIIEKMEMGDLGEFCFRNDKNGKIIEVEIQYESHRGHSFPNAYNARHLKECFDKLIKEKHIIKKCRYNRFTIKKRRFDMCDTFLFQKVGFYTRKVLVEKYQL